MPIGTMAPNTPTTVTPDPAPTRYSQLQGPAPDGPVVATDVLAALLAILNVQELLYNRFFTSYALWGFGSMSAGSSISVSPTSSGWTVAAYQDFGPMAGGTQKDDFLDINVRLLARFAGTSGGGKVAIGFSNDGGSTWAQTEEVPVVNESLAFPIPYPLQSQYQIANNDGTCRVAALVKADGSNAIYAAGYGSDEKRWGDFKVWRQVV